MSYSYSIAPASAASRARGSHSAFAFAIAIGCLWNGATAQAQSLSDRADRPPLRDALDTKTSTEKTADKDITIGLDIPVRFSSSVTNPNLDAIVEDRPDRHITPEVYLRWAHQYDWFKVSAEIGASIDRYFRTSDANLDSLHGSFKFAKTDGKKEYFVPYFSLSHDMFFLPTFSQPDITYDDVTVGFYSALAWRDKTLIPYQDALINYSDASEPGDMSILFDARFGRRMSDTASFQHTFVSGRITATYYISNNWRIEANSALRARWYENYHGERRTDWRPSAAIGLIWTPEWLTKLVKRSELSFNVEYYRNQSNIPDKSYKLWEIGPTLSLRTKF